MTREAGPRRDAVVQKNVVARRLDDRTVVVNLATSRIYELNRTAARLWELLEAGQDRESIERTLVDEFAVDEARAETEVDSTLAKWSKEGLIADDGRT
jgi:hypothetical protein